MRSGGDPIRVDDEGSSISRDSCLLAVHSNSMYEARAETKRIFSGKSHGN